MEIMPGFTLTNIKTSGAQIRLRHGGNGPPLLLLHGNPLTHASWGKIAGRLSQHFHVVAPDLRGYGLSDKPEGLEPYRSSAVCASMEMVGCPPPRFWARDPLPVFRQKMIESGEKKRSETAPFLEQTRQKLPFQETFEKFLRQILGFFL